MDVLIIDYQLVEESWNCTGLKLRSDFKCIGRVNNGRVYHDD